MQSKQNPNKLGILATLLTVSTLATLSSVQSKFLFERLSFNQHKAAKNPVLVSDSNVLAHKDTPLLQQSASAAVNQSIVVYNLSWLNTQSVNATDDFINNTNPRLQTSIRLDKEVYGPRDVVFAEVLLLNALNKTPVALSTVDRTIQQYYNLTLEILDTGNNILYNTTVLAGNSSAALAYKISDTLLAGDYVVRAYNQFVPVTSTSFTVRTALADPAIVSIQLPQQTYSLGETVRGIVKINLINGLSLPVGALTTFNVSFGNSTVANTSVTLSLRGDAVFSFAIPRYAATQTPTIAFTVRGVNLTYVYLQTFQLVNPDLLTIDFYPATGYLTNNVPNTIYFQAWTNSLKNEPLDVTGATLKQKVNTSAEITLINGGINTVAKGKGSFQWTPITTTGSLAPVLEVVINGVTIRRSVTFTASAFQPTTSSEVNFKILNDNRFLANNEDLRVQLITNATVNASETYVVQIKNAETVIWQDQYNLFANSTRNITVTARNFSVVNGGLLSVSVNKLTRNLENFYKSRPAVVPPTNTTNATNGTNTTTNATNGTNATKPAATTNGTNATNATTNGTNSTNATTGPVVVVRTFTFTPPDFANTTITTTFFEPKGELLFFKRPADGLRVSVTFDKPVAYLPGDTVSYTVSIVNITTGRPVTVDSYVTLSIVDVAGINGAHGSSLAARSYLSNQIKNFDNENLIAQPILTSIFSGANNDTRYVDVLLGVQGWRIGAFDVRSIVNTATILRTASPADQQAIQSLYSAVVVNQTRPVATVVRPNSARSGRQANESTPQDFMGNLTNPKAFAHPKRAGWTPAQKIDLTQTVAWSSTVVAKAGTLKGSIVLNDALTSYSVVVDAFNAQGAVGSVNATILTRDSLVISYTLPKFMVVGDSLKIPVSIANQGSAALQVRLFETLSDANLRVVVPTAAINLAANAAVSSFVTVTALTEKSGAVLNILANATVAGVTYSNEVSGSVSIAARDFIYKTQTRGGLIGSTAKAAGTANTAVLNVDIPADSNSTGQQFSMTVYPTFLSLVEQARRSLVAGPQGNFEEWSATVYPLIHRLTALRNGVQNADVQVQIVQLTQDIVAQYNSLLTYRIQEGANFRFEGQDLSTEAMTAYALIFFTDFAVGNTFVDANFLVGLQNYLLSRKNNRGGFIQSFSANSVGTPIPQITHDAFIIYALTYYSQTVNVATEILNLKSAADNQISANRVDSHLVALLANALYRLKRTTEAQVYADALVKAQNMDGSLIINNAAATSFNGANGTELVLQTTSLAVFVWNNNLSRYTSSITNATGFLYSKINNGMIGSSVATSFGLKAVSTNFATFSTINGNGTFTVSVNDQLVSAVAFSPSNTDAINIDLTPFVNNRNNSRALAPGQSLVIQLSVVNVTLPTAEKKDFRSIYSFNHRYMANASYVPPPPVNTTPEFTVTLTVGKTPVGLDAQNGKFFNYTVSAKNIMIPGSSASGPVNVVLGSPSCLELDAAFANNLINSGAIVGWEVVDNGLTVLLLRSLNAGETRSINVQYRQTFSGACTARDNLAYQANGDFEIAAKTRTV